MKKIDGKKVAEEILEDLKREINLINGRKPGLAAIVVGTNPASKIYVNKKVEVCREIGIISTRLELSEQTAQKALLKRIDELNRDNFVDGILVQLPLPKRINKIEVINQIAPDKDVDGFHPLNVGKLFTGNETFVPCTPKGIIRLLKHYKINPEGKNVTIVGHSSIVGKPLAAMFLNRNATVTICHKHTKNLAEETRTADILVVAVGKPNLITADMVKDGAIIFDVGINKTDGKICGDVDFDRVSKKAQLITPVPGGVGPMTVAMLMENTLLAYKQRINISSTSDKS